MSHSSTPILTPPTSLKPLPLPTWQHHNAANAAQHLADFRSKHLPQVLDAAHLTDVQRAEALIWTDDACLLRYLRARDYHLHNAAKMLQETLTWRVQYGVANLPTTTTTSSKPSAESKTQTTVSGGPDDSAAESAAEDKPARATFTDADADKASTHPDSAAAEPTAEKLAGAVVTVADGDADKASTSLAGPPCGIKPFQVENEAIDGNNYVNGFDIYGRPIVYLKKRSKPRDFDANVRLLVFTLEHAISVMPKGVEQVVLILDMSNYSRANSPPMHISKQTLHILTAHYPERLGCAFIVNAPAVFSFLWGIVFPFLNHVTREKIKFVSVGKNGKEGNSKNEMLDVVDKAVLEKCYGGEFEFVYDYNQYWKGS